MSASVISEHPKTDPGSGPENRRRTLGIVFPPNINNLTPELLTNALQEMHPSVQVDDFDVIGHFHCGDGLASTADRIALSLKFAQNLSDGIPDRVILKTILLHPYLRFGLPVILRLAKFINYTSDWPLVGSKLRPLIFTLVNIYQRYFPHAPDAMYINEVNFYRELRRLVSIEAPHVYASSFDVESGQFGILMDDLSLKGARFPNATENASLDQMTSLMTNLARLHATFWSSPRLQSEFAWIPTTTAGGMFPVFEAIGLDIIRDQVAKNPSKRKLIAPLGKSLEQMWSDVWRVQNYFNRQPPTLLHGDTHIGNTYLLPDNTAGLLDFQLLVKGHWAHDFSYAVITGLQPGDRRNHEQELLKFYLDQLGQQGVSAPDFESAWMEYRRGVLWGLVIGWLITPPVNYGEEITSANIARTVEAIRDLDTFSAIA